ncbi:MAG TPA: adenine phosphoribosyltransferase [Gemmatimonadaceae bacterium]|nr:adenine phosphoribosyltransferase [Gemmatimonadaceae bacterium]
MNHGALPDPAAVADEVRRLVRDVPDFPKPGITFKDITPLIAAPAAFRAVTECLAGTVAAAGVTHVVAIESRGFIFGAPVAQTLGAALIPVRKPGKLPARAIREEYALEYGTDALEMHADALTAGARALVVDDVLATGGTASATCALVERAGGTVVACAFVIELGFLAGRSRLAGRTVASVVSY